MDPAETEGTCPGEESPQLGALVGSREWVMAWLKAMPIIKAPWRGEEKTQRIEKNLRLREKEQEEEVYEEAQRGEIDSTMLPENQPDSQRDGPQANVTLEPRIPLLSTLQCFTLMGRGTFPGGRLRVIWKAHAEKTPAKRQLQGKPAC
ncbi:UNVERIFIED_CONTAM: hypothetical protein FKN15_036061 [Acipenser sinensis]